LYIANSMFFEHFLTVPIFFHLYIHPWHKHYVQEISLTILNLKEKFQILWIAFQKNVSGLCETFIHNFLCNVSYDFQLVK
jgi:hypothetical protein